MTILYIDDDADDREFLAEALASIDPRITCLTARDGRDALSLLAKLEDLPDFILLDINMPVMDGKECLKRLKTDQRLQVIPIFIYTTTSDAHEISVCYKLGALGVIRKPHTFRLLSKVLTRCVQEVGENKAR